MQKGGEAWDRVWAIVNYLPTYAQADPCLHVRPNVPGVATLQLQATKNGRYDIWSEVAREPLSVCDGKQSGVCKYDCDFCNNGGFWGSAFLAKVSLIKPIHRETALSWSWNGDRSRQCPWTGVKAVKRMLGRGKHV